MDKTHDKPDIQDQSKRICKGVDTGGVYKLIATDGKKDRMIFWGWTLGKPREGTES